MKLHLGCGMHYREGWVNIDNSPVARADHVINLDDKELVLPFEDNSCQEAEAIDVLEHINNIIPLMNEMWRVMKEGAPFSIEVPYAGSVDFYKDPTHVRGFVPQTFNYFAEWNTPLYGAKKWKIISSRHQATGEENGNRIWVTMTPVK